MLLVLPFIFSGGGSLTIMNQIGITIVLAMSYNMLLGQGGMLSFGHACVYGCGWLCSSTCYEFCRTGRLATSSTTVAPCRRISWFKLSNHCWEFFNKESGYNFAMISLGIGELVACCIIVTVFLEVRREYPEIEQWVFQPLGWNLLRN